MSERVYQSDSYLAETEARIIKKESSSGQWQVWLERTIFAPEAGGQLADSGTINDIPVESLREEGGKIIHILGRDPGAGTAHLKIDFQRRYDFMQQHTAQHLLSQVLVRLDNIPTLSFAIGPEHASIELGRSSLSDEEIAAAEQECFRLILENRPVKIYERDDLSGIGLRKPPKVSGLIRIVEIADYDFSACGGTHVLHTGEIGLVKIVRSDRVRSNVRIYYVAGGRALRDYQQKNQLVNRIQRQITLPPEQIPQGIENVLAEKEKWEKQTKAWMRKELDAEIDRWQQGPETLIVRRFDGTGIDEMKYFTAALIKKGKNVFAYSPGLQYILIGRGSGSCDLKRFSAEIFSLLSGKGGGRDTLIEGKAADFAKLDAALARLKQVLASS